ncbi:MAG: hypothetical protein WCE73_05245, partial [Candidatus Angelobacter sp.]
MKGTKLSIMTAKSWCVVLLFALVFSCNAHPRDLQAGAVYFGSTTTGAFVVADFNKDGHPDILTVDSGS